MFMKDIHTMYCSGPFTESQNHTMLGVGRDLRGSSSPTLPPKQGHLQQAAQDLVQAGLKYLQRRRLHHLPGQPVPVLRQILWCFVGKIKSYLEQIRVSLILK